MIALAVFTLVFIIAFLSIYQDDNRRMTALMFTLFTLMHTIIWGKSPSNGHLYYFTAALNDLMILMIITKLSCRGKLADNLINICIGFIVANALSWFVWFKGYSIYRFHDYALNIPDVCSFLSIGLYVMTIIALIKKDSMENGDYKINKWFDIFRFNNLAVNFSLSKLQIKGRH